MALPYIRVDTLDDFMGSAALLPREPEARLWAAVLAMALVDYRESARDALRRYKTVDTAALRQTEIGRWVFEDHRQSPGSLPWLCEALDLDVGTVRAFLRDPPADFIGPVKGAQAEAELDVDMARLARGEAVAAKICRGRCGRLLPLTAFTRNRARQDGLAARCRGCEADLKHGVVG